MIQGWEWIIILVVVLLVFGVGRIGKLGSELGKSVSSFRKGLREGQEELQQDENKKAQAKENENENENENKKDKDGEPA